MSDDTPTQRLDAPQPDGRQPDSSAGESTKSRGLLIALIAVGAALLIAVIALLIMLLGGNGKPTAAVTATTSQSATPSVTPSAAPSSTPTPTTTATPTTAPPPPPPSTKVAISGYSISPAQISCTNGTPNLSIHWSSVNGKTAYFGVNTADAQTGGMGWQLPPTGSDADFPAGYHPYPAICGQSTEYTITIVGADGSKASKMFTVTVT